MITPEQDLGIITQDELDYFLKTTFHVGESNIQLPTDFGTTDYPYCIQYSMDNHDYYLIVCQYYDAFSGYKTYYIINASVLLNDEANNGETTIDYIQSMYLKPIAGNRNVWTEWTYEDPYAYNFLKACGGAGNGSGSSQVIIRKWMVVT